jgi:hypothetical protein
VLFTNPIVLYYWLLMKYWYFMLLCITSCTQVGHPHKPQPAEPLTRKTLAARGLEEQRNFEELLTESVGRVHFS